MDDGWWRMEDDDGLGPYEQIEELMQPKVEPNIRHELIQNILSTDLTSHEKGDYMRMLEHYPEFSITSYENIKGLEGEEIHINLKE